MDTIPTTVEIQPETDASAARSTRGPLLFGAILILVGSLFLAFGRITIVPFVEDETRRVDLRHMWYVLSHNLPSVGHADFVRVAFWILISLVFVLCAALILLAATVRDADEEGIDQPA
jgi:H+/Cl- antiporter ClcA